MSKTSEEKTEKPGQAEQCPDCGNKLVPQGGCLYCPVCGWSKCGT